MNKDELYNLALSETHKYNLLAEIFAIRDKRVEKVDYTIGVDGFISLDVLNQYVSKINENTNLKQALNEIKDFLNKKDKLYLLCEGLDDILEIIDEALKDE